MTFYSRLKESVRKSNAVKAGPKPSLVAKQAGEVIGEGLNHRTQKPDARNPLKVKTVDRKLPYESKA